MAQIKFVQLSQAKYDAKVAQATTTQLQNQLNASIFFTTDTRRIYKGSVLYTQDFEVVSTTPVAGTAKEDRLYIVSTSGDMYIKYNGEIVQVGGNSAKIATIQQNIASNYSSISAISDEIYTAETGIKARLTTAEAAINALGSLGDGEQGLADALAKKLNVSAFNAYSSETSETLASLRTDVDANETAIASNTAEIDGVKTSITNLTSSSAVTVSSADGTNGVLKVYTITQGDQTVGTINIPKDLVVTSGSVVKGTWTNATFTEDVNGTGTALKLVIANQVDPVYINTLDLVKDHTGSTVDGITVTISDTNVISVSVADGSITEAKLHADVQAKLAKAVTAIQTTDMNAAISSAIADLDSSATAQSGNYINSITMVDGKITAIGQEALPSYTLSSGSANGTVSFNGTDVAVTGLKSAAYAETSAFDAAGAASAVLGTDADGASKATVYGAKAFAAGVQTTVTGTADDASTALTLNGLSKRIAALDSGDNSVANQVAAASASALEAANSYTDEALAWQVISDN